MLAGGVVAAVLASFALFAGTNADDIVVLTMLNISSRLGGRPRSWQIWTGQYAGFTVLVAASLAAAIRARRAGERVSPVAVSGLTGVMGLTIVNGGDNISVYTPVFRTSSLAGIALTVAVFMVGTALYCLAGSRLAAHHAIPRLIGRWGHWIVPAVFILIGVYIFYKTGLLS
jgi:cadmium resistance protein CadD (predicted permease)